VAKFLKNFNRFLRKLRLSQFHYTKHCNEFNMSFSDWGPAPIDLVNSLNKNQQK